MDVLQQLKQKREARVQDIYLDLPIPTWDGTLYARFEVLDRKVVEKFANQKRTVEADMDFILKATREIYMLDSEKLVEGAKRNEDNEDYVRIEDGAGNPVKFDVTLAEKLGEEQLAKAREVLNYCVKGNALAIGGLAGRLITWMQNTDAEIAGSLVGES